MRIIKLISIIWTLCLVFTSCKDVENELARQNVDEYTSYVDSISNLKFAEAGSNWKNIEKGHDRYKSAANANLVDTKENENLKNDIDEASLKFQEFKLELDDKEGKAISMRKDNLRMSLLGETYPNRDMKFEWINKDNILNVYQSFIDTAISNKNNYSKEDWDEIKLIYDAINIRKNTVENEGLTTSDNTRIAGLKLKFAPVYTLNKLSATSEDNAKVKQ